MEYKNKKVLVSGIARSGVSAAILLKKLGAEVCVQDLKQKDSVKNEAQLLEAENIELYLGKNPDDIADKFDLIVLSPGVPTDLEFIKKAESASIPVISEVELAYSVCKAPVLAVTGTNGKTTTTALLGEIVKNYKKGSVTVGNIGLPFSDEALNVDEDSFVAAELSSFQLEKIDKFKPMASAVLNITPDHLNRHKTIENYILAKERIFKNQDENDFLVLNYDDPVCRDMKNRAKAKTVFFSRKEKPKEGLYADDNSIFVKLAGYDEKLIDIDEMNILGAHNVENAMAAAAMALCASVPIDIIRKTLREFKAVEHRIEYVAEINGVEYYNDSKGTNPDAAIKAIEAMKRPILLIGGGYDKKSDFHQWIESFKGKVKFMAVIGEVSKQITDTADEIGFGSYQTAQSLEEAVKLCFEKAETGDCVLLSPACASWDMFESYEQRGKLFKDYVNELNLKLGR